MFTVDQRAAIRLHARLRAPSTRERRYAAGPARADRLPLGADRKLLRIDRGSNFVLSLASRSDWFSARRTDDGVRKRAGRVGVVVAHTFGVALQVG